MSATPCRPSLYVYDLPARYRDDREGGFGKPAANLTTFGTQPLPNVRLWNTAEFALGDLLLQRAHGYRCRTHNADTADLFFVPAYSSRQHNRPTERLAEGGNLRALYSRLRNIRVSRCAAFGSGADGNCSALEARGGADHILINPRNGASYENHPYAELDYADPRLGNATLLDLMEPGAWTERWPGNYKPEPRFHSIPHPSLVHLEPGVRVPPWRSTHRRATLVAGAFGVAHGSKEIVGLRASLQRACDAEPDHVCRFHKLGDKAGSARVTSGGSVGSGVHAAANAPASAWTHFWAARSASNGSVSASASAPSGGWLATVPPEPGWHAIARLYWNATFCMQPPGDAVSRKAIVDSLLLGCIPVLFHEGQLAQWPWHWGHWRSNASVLIDMGNSLLPGAGKRSKQLNAIDELRAIPAARVRHMQATIARHAHTMQYSAIDTASLQLPPLSSPRRIAKGAESASATSGAAVAEAATEMDMPRRDAAKLAHGTLFDAFDVALRHAWRRSRDASVIESGITTQRSAGAAFDAAIAAFELEPALGSWGGRNIGTCSRTWGKPGDCERGNAGTWRLGAAGGFGVVSLDDCTQMCRRCARCRWISLSLAHQQCDWYHSCNTTKLNRRFGGETFRTRGPLRPT